ncbi:hypothetical protein [Nocardioides alkalitolerans]|uniref:hypothetical protein n=1 Tax=Nocardioides alkalitolerans TaxID=281714 RepID=UPI0003F5441A|nr:hypothetical protein [Nocardioides alkalitolerans]
MRYFTRDWADGLLSDEETDQASEAYRARLAEIRPLLPPGAAELADADLHDAVIDLVAWAPHDRRLVASWVAGDLQRGYVEVLVVYTGVTLDAGAIEALRDLARDRAAELMYDEVDLADDGSLRHRLLFWPRHEVVVAFGDVQVTVDPRPDRRVDPGQVFHEEHPDDV